MQHYLIYTSPLVDLSNNHNSHLQFYHIQKLINQLLHNLGQDAFIDESIHLNIFSITTCSVKLNLPLCILSYLSKTT